MQELFLRKEKVYIPFFLEGVIQLQEFPYNATCVLVLLIVSCRLILHGVIYGSQCYMYAIHVQEAEEAAKLQAAKKGGGEGKGGKGGGGSKAGGKKGKDTPAGDTGPAIPLPEKQPVSMMKRGEEDTDSKYIG